MKMLMVKASYLILFVVLISVGVTGVWHIHSTLRDDPVIVAVGDIACANTANIVINPIVALSYKHQI